MKFSIRDLMWLTVVVALLLCSWLQYSAYVSKIDAMNSDLEKRTYESQIWEARTKELQNQAATLIERYSGAQASRTSAPTPNPSKP
jgi:hypothetical protein